MKNLLLTQDLYEHAEQSCIRLNDLVFALDSLNSKEKAILIKQLCSNIARRSSVTTNFEQAYDLLKTSLYISSFIQEDKKCPQLTSAFNNCKDLAVKYIETNLLKKIETEVENLVIKDAIEHCKQIDYLIEAFEIETKTLLFYANFKTYKKQATESYIKMKMHRTWRKRDEVNLKKRIKEWKAIAKYGKIDINSIEVNADSEKININNFEELTKR